MTKYASIEDGVVVLVDCNPRDGLIEAPDWVVPGVAYLDGIFSLYGFDESGLPKNDPGSAPEPSYVLLDEPEEGLCWCRGIDATLEAIAVQKDTILAAGFPWLGHAYQLREMDVGNLRAVLVAFALGGTNPHGGVWRDAANANVILDDTQMQALAVAALAYHRDVLRAWADHKDAVAAIRTAAAAAHPGDAAATLYAETEAAEDYDITAGWPVAS